jgi:lipoprotein LprG
MFRRRFLPLLVVAAVATSACSGDEEATDPAAIIAFSIERMGNVQSVTFFLERTGAPVFIDEDGLLEFSFAEGRFSAPESTDALLTVRAFGIPTQVGAVQIGDKTWITNPITGGWENAPSGFTFDVGALFDPDRGWSSLLVSGLTNVHFLTEEELDGELLAHFRVTAPADRIEQITAGMVRGQAVDGDLWIATSSGEIRELSFNTDMTEGVTTWRLRMTDYGAEVEISAPDLDG